VLLRFHGDYRSKVELMFLTQAVAKVQAPRLEKEPDLEVAGIDAEEDV
jgi:hypothetical protein